MKDNAVSQDHICRYFMFYYLVFTIPSSDTQYRFCEFSSVCRVESDCFMCTFLLDINFHSQTVFIAVCCNDLHNIFDISL